MLSEFNFMQLRKFTTLILALQKKNTLFGLLLGLIPPLVTALSIELFIGKIIGGDVHTNGLKGVSVLFFILFSNVISQSTEGLKRYGSIVKHSYLTPTTVILAETWVQYLSFMAAFLIVAITFTIPVAITLKLIVLSLLVLFYAFFIAYYLVVVSSILEDFSRVIAILFQVIFWVSPILYGIRQVDHHLAYFFMLSPFHSVFEMIYLIFTPSEFNLAILSISLLSSLSFILILKFLLSHLRKKVLVFL
jgi:ABC-type polysaccharide/polyol phosphate export permease